MTSNAHSRRWPLVQRKGQGRAGSARVSSARWVAWLLGLAAVGAVVLAGVHFSEERAFVQMARRAEPLWLGVAVLLQAGTYVAQGEIWRRVVGTAGWPLPLGLAFRLSLAKLFVDQALPSAGLSGTVVFARALEQRGLPREVVMAAVVVNTVTYYGAYLATLALALVFTFTAGKGHPWVLAVAGLFGLFGVAVMVVALGLAGRRGVLPRRWPLFSSVLGLLQEANPGLARRPALLLQGGMWQVAIILLDAATLWALLRSVGESASPVGVFVSFLLSSLVRTLGILPGGLGTFEAASVWTLRLSGVPLSGALAATLLFRGLSFWLPMLPGLAFSKEARRTP